MPNTSPYIPMIPNAYISDQKGAKIQIVHQAFVFGLIQAERKATPMSISGLVLPSPAAAVIVLQQISDLVTVGYVPLPFASMG